MTQPTPAPDPTPTRPTRSSLLADYRSLSPSERRLWRLPLMWAAAIAILFIPIVYVAVYLGSVWDPYGKLKDLPVALVEQDAGTTYRGKPYNLGQDLLDAFHDDPPVRFVRYPTQDAAQQAVREGRVYFALTVPADFSRRAIAGSSAEHGLLNLYVSEGTSYFASRVATTVSNAVAAKLNTELGSNRWEKVKSSLVDVQTGFADIRTAVRKLSDGAGTLQNGTATLQKGARDLASGAVTAADGSTKLTSGARSLSSGVSSLTGGVTQLSGGLRQLNDKAPGKAQLQPLQDGTASLAQGAASLAAGTAKLQAGAQKLATGATSLASGAAQVDGGTAQLAAQLPELSGGLTQLQAGAQKLAGGAASLASGAAQVDGGTAQLAAQLPELSGGLTQLQAGAQKLAGGATSLATGAGTLSSGIRGFGGQATQLGLNAAQLQALQGGAGQLQSGADALKTGAAQLQTGAAQLSTGLGDASKGAQKAATGAAQLRSGTGALKTGAAQLQTGAAQLSTGLGDASKGAQKAATGAAQLRSGTGALKTGAAQLQTGAAQLATGLGDASKGASDLNAGANRLQGGVQTLVDGNLKIKDALGTITAKLPASKDLTALSSGASTLASRSADLATGLGKLRDGSAKLATGATDLNTGATKLKDGLDTLYSKVPATVEQLGGDPEGLSESVTVVTTTTAPVGNNGSAFAPYFIALGLWVGCTLTTFIFPYLLIPESARHTGQAARVLRKFTVPGIYVVLQALIVVYGVHLLGVHYLHPALVTVTAVAASLTFMLFVLALNLLLGAAGRLLALVLLVIQLAASGGSYPVELSSPFFRWLHTYIPVTDAINAMRYAMFGAYEGQYALFMTRMGLVALASLIVALLSRRRWMYIADDRFRSPLVLDVG